MLGKNAQIINPFGLLQDVLARLFFRYGFFIARHPHPFIIGPIIVTLLLMLGILNLHVEDDLRFLYSPEHSLSRFEYQIHKEFSGDTIKSSYIAIALEAAAPSTTAEDDYQQEQKKKRTSALSPASPDQQQKPAWKNMLRREIATAITGFHHFVMHNMTVELPDGSYHFGNDICSRLELCPISNTIIQLFFEAFFSEKLRKDPRIGLHWPILKFFENKFFLPTNFYGVVLNESAVGVDGSGFDSIRSIQMVHLVYHIAGTEKYTAEEVGISVEKSLRQALAERSNLLKSSLFSLAILKTEMQKNTTYTLPFITITILLLMAFTVCSCLTGDAITSKPLEALLGLFSSSLAIGSSAGLLLMMGVPFIHQVTVVPFLAFAIGVDDTYVMLGAWQDTKRNQCAERRMALSLEEAGSAITVTSLTSFLSFGIGTFSATPAISIFCKFIAVAVLFDWIYQITFFAAVMALGGRREAAGHHCLLVWRRMSKEEICKAKSTNFVSPTHHVFANMLAPFLCHPITRLCFIGIYALYMFGAFYGCSLLRPNLTPSRLLVDDSPLSHYMHLAEQRIWSEGVIGRVYVNNAPDFGTNPEQLDRLMRMVEELESTPFSMGSNSTQLWLREFNNYRQYFASEPDDQQGGFYDTLRAFLKISFNKQWASFIHWAPNPTKEGKNYVDKFYFTTAFKIPNWNVRTQLLLIWRNITARYPDFQALVFDDNNFFSDQMLELKQTTLSSLGTAILAMILVCILFIADSAIVFWVSFMLVSMDIGVAGYLSLWGSDLDPTTVVNILMSIGLCIDFATHVGYRTYRSRCRDPDERIADALGAIGWPVVQAGVSTFLGIIVMLLVPSNVVRMFARTNILVVATGLFHGLFILPIIIRSFAFGIGDGGQLGGNGPHSNRRRPPAKDGLGGGDNKVGPAAVMMRLSMEETEAEDAQTKQKNNLERRRPDGEEQQQQQERRVPLQSDQQRKHSQNPIHPDQPNARRQQQRRQMPDYPLNSPSSNLGMAIGDNSSSVSPAGSTASSSPSSSIGISGSPPSIGGRLLLASTTTTAAAESPEGIQSASSTGGVQNSEQIPLGDPLEDGRNPTMHPDPAIGVEKPRKRSRCRDETAAPKQLEGIS